MGTRKLTPPIVIYNAATISGAGRGKGLGIPTINIDLAAVPLDLEHGIYACWITLDDKKYMGAMHYGPRPVFKDSIAFEVHIIGETVLSVPETVDVEIVGYIRAVANFRSAEALVVQIDDDVRIARGMLSA